MQKWIDSTMPYLGAHPVAAFVFLAMLSVLFIVGILAAAAVYRSRYRIPVTPPEALSLDKLVGNLRDEANTLAGKLQKRIAGYTVLNFALVMVEILGSLFFAVTGLHGQFGGGGGEANKVSVSPILATVVGTAILLAGSLKAGFQPNTRKVEYSNREWALSNTINDAETVIAYSNASGQPNAATLEPVAKLLNDAIRAATKPLT